MKPNAKFKRFVIALSLLLLLFPWGAEWLVLLSGIGDRVAVKCQTSQFSLGVGIPGFLQLRSGQPCSLSLVRGPPPIEAHCDSEAAIHFRHPSRPSPERQRGSTL